MKTSFKEKSGESIIYIHDDKSISFIFDEAPEFTDVVSLTSDADKFYSPNCCIFDKNELMEPLAPHEVGYMALCVDSSVWGRSWTYYKTSCVEIWPNTCKVFCEVISKEIWKGVV